MKLTDRLRYLFFQTRQILSRKKDKAWSGITLLVIKEDSADPPTSIRINYYILIFLGLILASVSLGSLTISIIREIGPPETSLKRERRRAVLENLQIMARQKFDLLEEIENQLERYHSLSLTDAQAPSWLDDAIEDDPSLYPDSVSRIQNITGRLHHYSDKILNTTSYYVLEPVFHRAHLYDIMPRGRPLPSRIGVITSPFGMRKNPFDPFEKAGDFHSGIDLAAAPGSPIVATAPGRVIFLARSNQGYGLHFRIHHGYGYTTLYAHNSALYVNTGDFIKRGQHVSALGRSGSATGNHLHYEVLYGPTEAVDPLEFIQIK